MSKPDPNFEPEYDVADVEHEEAVHASYEDLADPDYEADADPEYDDTLQADYEQVADPDYDDIVAQVEEIIAPAVPVTVPAAAPDFAFEVGRPVVPLSQAQPHAVLWRGHLKERHLATGLVQRVPVYRLDDGYWDCYREEELQAA